MLGRRGFLLGVVGATMSALGIKKYLAGEKFPTIFFGHGSPMNIVADNRFTQTFQKVGETLPLPKAILCVSAHWLTEGTQVDISAMPKQIFDFGGFPEELYQKTYSAPGQPELAGKMAQANSKIAKSSDWGLDHGAWAVLYRMYPKANVPVFQMSLNRRLKPLEHLELAQSLKVYRDQGVLILGSGNIVHNLRRIEWDENAKPHSWAEDFEAYVLETVQNRNLSAEDKVNRIFSHSLLPTAHPTVEHLLPLVYNLGVMDEASAPQLLVKGIQNASVSMAAIQG